MASNLIKITHINKRKLTEIAAAIAAGKFKIDAHKIARKIIATSALNQRQQT